MVILLLKMQQRQDTIVGIVGGIKMMVHGLPMMFIGGKVISFCVFISIIGCNKATCQVLIDRRIFQFNLNGLAVKMEVIGSIVGSLKN